MLLLRKGSAIIDVYISSYTLVLVAFVHYTYVICASSSYTPKANDSVIWKKVIAQHHISRKEIKWKINNEKNTLFWIDK